MYSHQIRCAHQSAPLHQVSFIVPPYIRYSRQIPLSIIFTHHSAFLHHIPHQSAPFLHKCKSDCPFPSHVPIRVLLSTVCAHLCPFPQYVPIRVPPNI
ncbi:unnamed protein product, partial [Staurois parvus]